MRALAARPVAFESWPAGIAKPGHFRQNVPQGAPSWLASVETPTDSKRGPVRHPILDRPEALLWLAQKNFLTVHAWHSRVPHLATPDWVVFDLDPADGHTIEQVIPSALTLRGLLDELGLPSVPKTSGKRGLHVLVPLAPGHSFDDTLAFAEHVGGAITSVRKEATMERMKKNRHGRFYFDCYQNGFGKTLVAPYSPRALDGAPVSAPLDWSEVAPGLDPAAFTIRTLPERLARRGDLFAPALTGGVRLPRFR